MSLRTAKAKGIRGGFDVKMAEFGAFFDIELIFEREFMRKKMFFASAKVK